MAILQVADRSQISHILVKSCQARTCWANHEIEQFRNLPQSRPYVERETSESGLIRVNGDDTDQEDYDNCDCD